MKMTPINPADYKMAHKSDPLIRFTKNGPISLNKGAAIQLELKASDHVLFAYNEAGELYIFKCKDNGFTCRGKADLALTFNSAAYATRVLKDAKVSEGAASFMIAKVPEVIEEVNYYAVFTSKAINKK